MSRHRTNSRERMRPDSQHEACLLATEHRSINEEATRLNVIEKCWREYSAQSVRLFDNSFCIVRNDRSDHRCEKYPSAIQSLADCLRCLMKRRPHDLIA